MSVAFSIVDIFFVIAAVVIAIRIYSVLGKRTGFEKKPSGIDSFSFDDAVGEVAPQTVEDFGEWTNSVKEFREHETSFHPTAFLEKAGKAMEMILTSFFKGDRAALKMLLSEKLYEEFSQLIQKRESEEQTAELSYFRLVNSKIEAMDMTPNHMKIVVAFKTEQTLIVKDAKGVIIEGDENIVETIDDAWTFIRPFKSKQPTWLLAHVK